VIVDCAVFPRWPHTDDIREYMKEPWRSKPFATQDRLLYANPLGEYHTAAAEANRTPGSDPLRVARDVGSFADAAVLTPLTRGLHHDVDLDAEICHATNRWLVERWLDGPAAERLSLWGSIRVAVGDVDRAIREIEEWSAHPRMVQIAVPLQSQHPYGNRYFFRIWEAAAARGLPVAVAADGGAGVEFWPTSVGYPRHFIEYAVLSSAVCTYHAANLVAEGVFEQLPELRFVFLDGGHDLLTAFNYRLDLHWRSTRYELPWVKRLPSDYFREHLRFIPNAIEGPSSARAQVDWYDVGRGDEMSVFGSRYPFWDFLLPSEALPHRSPEVRDRLLFKNARALYPRARFDGGEPSASSGT
jgi:predicted TIM-barrel fold metal-dependent hydrolase